MAFVANRNGSCGLSAVWCFLSIELGDSENAFKTNLTSKFTLDWDEEKDCRNLFEKLAGFFNCLRNTFWTWQQHCIQRVFFAQFEFRVIFVIFFRIFDDAQKTVEKNHDHKKTLASFCVSERGGFFQFPVSPWRGVYRSIAVSLGLQEYAEWYRSSKQFHHSQGDEKAMGRQGWGQEGDPVLYPSPPRQGMVWASPRPFLRGNVKRKGNSTNMFPFRK